MLLTLLLSLAGTVALAADGSLALGAERTWNDPFTRATGLRMTAATEPLPWLRLGVTGGAYLGGESQTRSALARQLVYDYQLGPPMSPILGRGLGEVTWIPVRSTEGPLRESLGFTMGFGAVFTDDDTEALGVDPNSDDFEQLYEAYDRELHPTIQLGLVGELRGEVWGVRLRLERLRYVEIVGGDYENDKAPTWLGAELAWYTGAR